MEPILLELTNPDDKQAYQRTKEIAATCVTSNIYYKDLELFASLLDHEKSYVRTRAFILCCSLARWDSEHKLDAILPDLLKCFHDPKPTVVRQSLNAILELLVYRPQYKDAIKKEVESICLSSYKDSMIPLLQKDCSKVLELIQEL